MAFALCLIAVVVFATSLEVYVGIKEEKLEIKENIEKRYHKLILLCKHDPEVLKWVTTLKERFEEYMKSEEYSVRKPYDYFRLRMSSNFDKSIGVYIVIDGKLKPKLTINFLPILSNDKDWVEKRLEYCISYEGLDDFIEKCKRETMIHSLEKERIKKVEDIINK